MENAVAATPGKTKTGSLWVVGAALLFGTIGLFTNILAARGASAAEVVFFRCLVTAVTVGAVMLARDRRLFRVRPRDTWIFACQGVIGVAGNAFCYQISIRMAGMSVAAALLYTAPAFVALFAPLFLRERLTARKLIAVAATVAGAFLVSGAFGGGTGGGAVGIVIGILAGLCYSFYTIFGGLAVKRGYTPFTVTFYAFAFASVAMLPLLDYGELASHVADPAMLGLFVLAGLVCSTLPYFMYTVGLSKIPAGTASVIATLEPVAAAVIGFLVFSEPLGVGKIVGMALILAAAVIAG